MSRSSAHTRLAHRLAAAFAPASLALGLVASSVHADVVPLANIGGTVDSIALIGNGSKVAAGVGQHLAIYDISNAGQIVPIGDVEVGGKIWDVDVVGTTAYVSAERGGLVVVNIADPAHPTVVTSLDLGGYADGAAISGNTLYLANGFDLQVLSIANPLAPVPITSYADGGWIFDVEVNGSLACAVSDDNVRVFNIASPTAPVLTGTYVAHSPGLIAMTGNLVLVPEPGLGCKIVSLANPANPTLVGNAPCNGDYLWSVSASGTKAYVGGYHSLHVIDITAAAAPVSLASLSSSDINPRGTVITGTKLCAADWGGVAQWNVTNPASPIKTSRLSTFGSVSDVAIFGTTAYVTSWTEGLWIYDTTNPSEPLLRSHVPIDGGIYEIAVQGGYVYLAAAIHAAGSRILIYNVTNPQTPVLVANQTIAGTGDFAYGVCRSGSNLYVATFAGLRIMNVANPANPVWLSYISIPGGGYDVAVSGSVAAVASDTYAVHFLNVANPSAPVLASTIVENTYLNEIALVNGIATVGIGFGELERYNVSNPAQPIALPGAVFGGYSNDLAVSGSTVWVANEGLGIREVDFSGGVGVPVASYGSSMNTQEIAVAGHVIAVGDGGCGFFLYGDCAATADLNCDGFVNAADLSLFLAEWGSHDSSADFNHDGTVDAADLSVLLSQWG